ncbi:hypothetical protein B0A81_01475 [Flavobacterium plurextorum]|uniref:Uncharacterized protein n=1 Tax=Flavobacterium plurextorum TaxID=1114867 RepID=A0ABX4D0L9_9FLAO|nr:hypothetical protein [Flavobacterium plurextorum]OXB11230.1 hypothetical protein B0A81_01475 [Flavobacterium plurextorum]
MKLFAKFKGLMLFLLLSFTSVFASPPSPKNSRDKVEKTPMSVIVKLVDLAYNDSISKLLFEYEVKRVQSEFDTSTSERENRIKNFLELSKKEKLSDDDIKYVATELGFSNVEEYTKYLDLAAELIAKYEIMKLDKESQLVFCELFFHKLVEEMKGKGSIVFIKFNKNMEAIERLFPPACKKCAWDYGECMKGSTYSLNTSFSFSQARTMGSIISSGDQLTTTATSTTQGIFLYTSWSSSACSGLYHNCLAGCDYNN